MKPTSGEGKAWHCQPVHSSLSFLKTVPRRPLIGWTNFYKGHLYFSQQSLTSSKFLKFPSCSQTQRMSLKMSPARYGPFGGGGGSIKVSLNSWVKAGLQMGAWIWQDNVRLKESVRGRRMFLSLYKSWAARGGEESNQPRTPPHLKSATCTPTQISPPETSCMDSTHKYLFTNIFKSNFFSRIRMTYISLIFTNIFNPNIFLRIDR